MSEYDDDDVQTLSSGIKTGGDGKFDIGYVFRLLDRDKDGIVSMNDWGVVTGSGPGLGSRMTSKQVAAYAKNADDEDIQHKMMAGIFPFFKWTFLRTCPPELRKEYVDLFPEMLDADFKEVLGMNEEKAPGACPHTA